ncbi:MAG: hypothetical protein EZS28_028503 [Streblomastix strix]|uniref:Rhodanese domain-containing protein n=1 Tax=Streblomastix strix TaxID=222440 RepID=A0A5J4UZM1_9EUKA|nr:MAG: hypothetical protein EZS28_028503 [Streblomastix strix]
MARIQLVEPYELAQWIDVDSNGIIVMDVRDSDYYGYKIPGSRNIPANQFGQNVDILIENLRKQVPTPTKIVFHCQYCRTRGPTAARLFFKKSQNILPQLEVYILNGGFDAYEQRFKNDDSKLERIY